MENLNELARSAYVEECEQLVADLNRLLSLGQEHLRLPDTRFHRRIGDHAGMPYSLEGQLLPEASYGAYLDGVLPTDDDRSLLESVSRTGDWVAPHGRKADAL
jgi:hypothetical protein